MLFTKQFPRFYSYTHLQLIYPTLLCFSSSVLPCKDMRGHHKNRPHAFYGVDVDLILNISNHTEFVPHIMQETRLYLSVSLNISKMYSMFMEKHPNRKFSYKSYRGNFDCKFNISFGYPRKNTCCDKIKKKMEWVDSQIGLPSESHFTNTLNQKNEFNVSF